MFNKFGDNRKMEEVGAGGGGGGSTINLSGHVYDQPGGGAGAGAGGAGGAAGAGGAGGTGETEEQKAAREAAANAKVLNPIGDETDKYIVSVLNNKYNNKLDNIRINGNGEVVNLDGEVLVKKDELSTLTGTLKTELQGKADAFIKTLKTVEIEGTDYNILDDGSVKNEKGEVLLTTEQLRDKIMESDDYLDDSDDDSSVYELADAITGFELTDDEGNVVTFDSTPQGLAQRDLHIARQEGLRIAQEQLNGFFANNPGVLEAYNYIKAHGTWQGLGSRTNHEGVEVDKDNEQQHVDLIVEAEMMRGLSKEAATKRANMFKDNDMAFDEAKAALTYMVGKEKADRDADRIAAENKAKEAQDTQTKYWADIERVINTGKLMEYTIPENIRVREENGVINLYSRQDFLDYVRKPVKGNLTQAQLDAQNEPLERKLFADYLRFVRNDMSYIAGQRVQEAKVDDFKQRFSRKGIPGRKVVISPSNKNKSNNDKIQFNK